MWSRRTALGFLILIAMAAILAPWITYFSFEVQDVDRILLSPNSLNWFGTDNLGRDLFSRILFGARVSLGVALSASFISCLVGFTLGAVAGYEGGITEKIVLKVCDIVQSIPPMVLMILVSVFFNAMKIFDHEEWRSVLAMVTSLSLIGWMNMTRVVRAQVAQVKNLEFVQAAVALGDPKRVILWRHIVPQIMGPALVILTFQIPTFILFESFMSFIGLGLQPPYSSWGVLAQDGWRSLRSYPHLILFPGVTVFLTMLAFNILGDSLRDEWDPKTPHRHSEER